ncbi:hypothetical protein ACRQ5Q_42615 (plasmid) [Bradyrhizobium sp. PMVTL-01]|uniref:hypothetical protein n=1 Tax=Bradyrhizobium sp. PMVTL-01 TaxID=3434999 RepID=UPI003F6E81C4
MTSPRCGSSGSDRTRTLPLTRGAKLLMLLQAALSVVTLTAVAGSAIGILAAGK